MSASPKFNRVFLPDVGFWRSETTKDGHDMFIRDYLSFAYQVEELISLGAIEVAVETGWGNDFLKTLPIRSLFGIRAKTGHSD
jgi:hypothetical protein